MSFDLKQWYQKMNEGDIILSYKGSITAELITEVLETVEQRLNETIENRKLKKKVYNVLVEALQNLFHHIDYAPTDNGDMKKNLAVFVFSKEDNNTYKVSTGNFVKIDKIQLLKDRLDQINFLSSEQLKVVYKMVLNNQEFSEKGGGGLGMLDMARKTGNKLNYNFYNYNKEFFFFSMDVLISG